MYGAHARLLRMASSVFVKHRQRLCVPNALMATVASDDRAVSQSCFLIPLIVFLFLFNLLTFSSLFFSLSHAPSMLDIANQQLLS